MTRSLIDPHFASSCYFRSSTPSPYRKAILQITERCNLHCAHCFVNATRHGVDMALEDIKGKLLPRLLEARVTKVTLTGGEPSVHADWRVITQLFVEAGLPVAICSNGTTLTQDDITFFRDLGDVHFNVSLDGFSAESHGRFRGDPDSFETTIANIKHLANAKLLQGILVTPNGLGSVNEYHALCRFAKSIGARYVLLNPLSAMGRGNATLERYRADDEVMKTIMLLTKAEETRSFETVHIRFPNDSQPLAGCDAGTIFYVFAPGDVAVCPYLVFAARTPQSKHDPGEFIVGNIFDEPDIAARLDEYRFHDRYKVGENGTCQACGISGECGKGCPASVIASGEKIGALDREVCPVAPVNDRHAVQLQGGRRSLL